MTQPKTSRVDRAPEPAPVVSTISPRAAFIAGWLVPGAGHFLVGQTRKAAIFFVVLLTMFVLGLAFGGRLFPFPHPLNDPLVFLAALSEWAMGIPRLLAAAIGGGAGEVTRVTYEPGNTFLVAAGLLNALVAFNASDVAQRQSRRSVSGGGPA